jgi:hypothetical protein
VRYVARAIDIYGNDVLWNYDDATELDEAGGNIRYFRNRITNSWEGVSLQPITGPGEHLPQCRDEYRQRTAEILCRDIARTWSSLTSESRRGRFF